MTAYGALLKMPGLTLAEAATISGLSRVAADVRQGGEERASARPCCHAADRETDAMNGNVITVFVFSRAGTFEEEQKPMTKKRMDANDNTTLVRVLRIDDLARSSTARAAAWIAFGGVARCPNR